MRKARFSNAGFCRHAVPEPSGAYSERAVLDVARRVV